MTNPVVEWIIYDLSLVGQYPSPGDFLGDLEGLLRVREEVPVLRERLTTSAQLGERPVSGQTSLKQSLWDCQRRELQRKALHWLTKGPFWESRRQPFAADSFEWNREDVTDYGLGEAARRRLCGYDTQTFSFKGWRAVECKVLNVGYLRPDSQIDTLEVPNVWELKTLRRLARTADGVAGWAGLLTELAEACPAVKFDHQRLLERLECHPYDSAVADRARDRFGILQQFMELRNLHGDGSRKVTELLANHFQGTKAPFSDESETNYSRFREKLTFSDPLDPERQIFCTWHGKIRTPLPYRIHFEWPVPGDQAVLKVCYFGPKITKA